MATAAFGATRTGEVKLTRGPAIMAIAGIGFVGYGVLFFVQNFTGFLELGISHAQVDVGRAEIEAFSPSLTHYLSHLHIALAGSIAAVASPWPRSPGSASAAASCGHG